MEQVNCLEETTEFENSLWCGSNLQGVKISEKNFNESRKGLNRQEQKMTLKRGKTTGRSKVTSFIVIMLNLDFKTTCGKNTHFQFHWIAFMWPGLLTKIWMCCKKPVLTIIGTSMWIEVYQIHGQDSRIVNKKTSFRIYVFQGAPYEDPSNCQTWLFVAWNLVHHVQISAEEGKGRMGNGEAKAR